MLVSPVVLPKRKSRLQEYLYRGCWYHGTLEHAHSVLHLVRRSTDESCGLTVSDSKQRLAASDGSIHGANGPVGGKGLAIWIIPT